MKQMFYKSGPAVMVDCTMWSVAFGKDPVLVECIASIGAWRAVFGLKFTWGLRVFGKFSEVTTHYLRYFWVLMLQPRWYSDTESPGLQPDEDLLILLKYDVNFESFWKKCSQRNKWAGQSGLGLELCRIDYLMSE